MLRILLVSTIVLHAAIAFGEEAGQQRVRYSTRVMRIPNETARREWCGRPAHIRACTRIIAIELASTSTEDHGMWRVKATAGFIALIALLDTTRYGHELNHVRDIEMAIDSYIAEVEKSSFPTLAACEAARREASQKFKARVQAFADASNLERDGYSHQ